jgi:hypothetical protein
MKKFIFILLSITLYITNSYAAYIKNGAYTVKYRYINNATSPINGNKRYKILIKDKIVREVVDLKRGILIAPQNAFGLYKVMQVLLGNKDKFKVSNINGNLVIKTDKAKYCSTFIYIDKIKRVPSSYTLNPITERKKELRTNYTKWLRKGVNNYIIRIQDSRLSNIYKEGVELTIKNGKIISAKDVRNYTNIDPNNKYFLTVPKLFGIAKWGIKDAIIDYDSNYYYPTYIKLKNGISIYAYYLKPL